MRISDMAKKGKRAGNTMSNQILSPSTEAVKATWGYRTMVMVKSTVAAADR
jgi:hypothetical protein